MDEGCVRVRWYVVPSGEYINATYRVCTEPAMDSETCGKTFACVLGTNTSAFELIVLKRKIMGPCWLRVKKPHAENKGVGPVTLRWWDGPERSPLDFMV